MTCCKILSERTGRKLKPRPLETIAAELRVPFIPGGSTPATPTEALFCQVQPKEELTQPAAMH